MHTQVEMVNLNDIEFTAEVMAEFALKATTTEMEGYLCY